MNEMDRFRLNKAIETQQSLYREAERILATDAEKYAYAYRVLIDLQKAMDNDSP